MNLEKLKKIKADIEAILQQAKNDATKKGTDIKNVEFEQKISDLRQNLIRKLGISPREYFQVDRQLVQEAEAEKNADYKTDILVAMREVNAEKNATSLPKDLMQLKIRLGQFLARGIWWDDVKGRPPHVLNPFDQEAISNLHINQTDHTDTDHQHAFDSIMETVRENINNLSDEIRQARQSLQNEFSESLKNIKINHKDLAGIGSDDHHSEIHSLESHSETEWKELFRRLTSGGFVDDLHRHKIEFPKYPWVGEAWGMTQNDGDQRYVKYSGGITMPTIAGNASLVLGVKSDESGLEWVVGGTGSGLTILVATGTIDDNNVDFTFTEKPTIIVMNGALYIENYGWTWTAGTLTATMDIPAGVGGTIFGLK